MPGTDRVHRLPLSREGFRAAVTRDHQGRPRPEWWPPTAPHQRQRAARSGKPTPGWRVVPARPPTDGRALGGACGGQVAAPLVQSIRIPGGWAAVAFRLELGEDARQECAGRMSKAVIGDAPLGIDDHHARPSTHLQGVPQGLVHQHHRVRRSSMLGDPGANGGGVLGGADGQDDDATILKEGPRFHEGLVGRPARDTPHRPEIEDHDGSREPARSKAAGDTRGLKAGRAVHLLEVEGGGRAAVGRRDEALSSRSAGQGTY